MELQYLGLDGNRETVSAPRKLTVEKQSWKKQK